MSEIISVIPLIVEVIMEKYGFGKVIIFFLFAILLWKLPDTINSIAKLIEVIKVTT